MQDVVNCIILLLNSSLSEHVLSIYGTKLMTAPLWLP